MALIIFSLLGVWFMRGRIFELFNVLLCSLPGLCKYWSTPLFKVLVSSSFLTLFIFCFLSFPFPLLSFVIFCPSCSLLSIVVVLIFRCFLRKLCQSKYQQKNYWRVTFEIHNNTSGKSSPMFSTIPIIVLFLVTPLLIVGCRFQLESSKVIDEKLGIVEVALSKMQHKKTRVEERCLWEMLMQVTSPKKTTLSIIHSLPHDYSRIDRGFPAPTVVVGWNDPGPLSWLSSLADLRVLGSRLGWHWLATPKDHHLYMCIYKYNVYINNVYIYIFYILIVYIYMHYMHIKKTLWHNPMVIYAVTCFRPNLFRFFSLHGTSKRSMAAE